MLAADYRGWELLGLALLVKSLDYFGADFLAQQLFYSGLQAGHQFVDYGVDLFFIDGWTVRWLLEEMVLGFIKDFARLMFMVDLLI